MKTIRKTVLFADDDLGLLTLLRGRCERMGMDVITATDAMAALNAARDDAPDLVCVDVGIPGGNGLAVLEMLTSDDRSDAIPKIVMTDRNDRDVQRRCENLAAHYLLKTPDIWSNLEPLLRQLLRLGPMDGRRDESIVEDVVDKNVVSQNQPNKRSRRVVMRTDTNRVSSNRIGAVPPVAPMVGASIQQEGESVEGILDAVFALMGDDDESTTWDPNESAQPWVLCVDDDRDFSRILAHRLERWGIGVMNAFDAMDGVRKAFSQPANAIILDFNMPNQKGDYVLRRIRETPATCDTPVIMLTGNKDDRVRRTMLDLGADAFLYKPPQFDVLIRELRRHIEVPSEAGRDAVLGGCESN